MCGSPYGGNGGGFPNGNDFLRSFGSGPGRNGASNGPFDGGSFGNSFPSMDAFFGGRNYPFGAGPLGFGNSNGPSRSADSYSFCSYQDSDGNVRQQGHGPFSSTRQGGGRGGGTPINMPGMGGTRGLRGSSQRSPPMLFVNHELADSDSDDDDPAATSNDDSVRAAKFIEQHTDFLSHADTSDLPNTECPICYEGIPEHICVRITGIPGCNHLIGLECLQEMLKHQPGDKDCPLCRTEWIPDDGIWQGSEQWNRLAEMCLNGSAPRQGQRGVEGDRRGPSMGAMGDMGGMRGMSGRRDHRAPPMGGMGSRGSGGFGGGRDADGPRGGSRSPTFNPNTRMRGPLSLMAQGPRSDRRPTRDERDDDWEPGLGMNFDPSRAFRSMMEEMGIPPMPGLQGPRHGSGDRDPFGGGFGDFGGLGNFSHF